MTWTQIWAGFDFKLKDVDGTAPHNVDEFVKNPHTKELLAQSVSCNCIGTVDDAGATELAMLKFIKRCGVDYEDYRKRLLPKEYLRFQFDSSRKRMSTVCELKENHENGYNKRLLTKGASEIVVETCSHYLDAEGNKQVLDDIIKQELEATIKAYAK
jgi:Ca2+-transporting ATPase